NLVKAVKTIAIQKQRQYLIVAKFVFDTLSQLYKPAEISTPVAQSPSQLNPSSEMVYSVNHLVINAGSAQLIAPISTVQTDQNQLSPNPEFSNEILPPPYNDDDYSEHGEPDIYAWVAHDIDTDAQQMRLKKLLLYTYQDIWENDLRQLNNMDWAGLLRELVSFMPTFLQLQALLQESVYKVSKPAEYAVIGSLLLTKLEPLYADVAYKQNDLAIASPSILVEMQPDLTPNSYHKVPFDPQIASNLFDLRLELMRFANSMRAKILLFSLLYYPFNPDRDNWQDLRTHALDQLLRQLFYAYPSFEQAEKAIGQTARSLNEPKAYDQSASYILKAVKVLYDLLEEKSMLHPAEGGLPASDDDDGDFTQPTLFRVNGNDDDSCQFG
ncbi:MAG: hypothetical protein WCQ26_06320, partial [Pseudanabaena sp. ELA748]